MKKLLLVIVSLILTGLLTFSLLANPAVDVDPVPAGANGPAKIEISIYPNPVTDGKLTVESKDYTIKEIEVLSIVGKAVFFQTYEREQKVIISLNDLEKGLYIVTVRFEGRRETATEKFMIK